MAAALQVEADSSCLLIWLLGSVLDLITDTSYAQTCGTHVGIWSHCFYLAFRCHLLSLIIIFPSSFPNLIVTHPISDQVWIFPSSHVDVGSRKAPCPGWVSLAQTPLPPLTLGCSTCEMGLIIPVQPPPWYHQMLTD